MRRKVKEKIPEPVAQDQCRHHWIIEAANGPKSKGVCKYCGEVKYFSNAMPDFAALKRKTNPLDLPKMPKVALDDDSKS